jgi:hypothetical protein
VGVREVKWGEKEDTFLETYDFKGSLNIWFYEE